METNTIPKKFLAEQVTSIARIALKNLVGKGLLPWPQIYNKEFWDVAVSEGFSAVSSLRHGQHDLTPEILQEFMDETNEILGEVRETVEEFVQVTKDHVNEVKLSLKSMDKKDEEKIFHEDIAALRQKNKQLEEQAKQTENKVREQAKIIADLRAKVRIDGLTGLLNRRALENDLQKELSKVKRYHYPLSLIMCDIDHFKRINDTYGHGIGDKVLRNLALIWKKSVRETDSVYRYGGEEFMIIAPHTSKEDSFKLAERLRKKVSTYKFVVEPPDKFITITVSLGVTQMQPEESVQELIDRVDKALYKAKKGGRNRTVVL